MLGAGLRWGIMGQVFLNHLGGARVASSIPRLAMGLEAGMTNGSMANAFLITRSGFRRAAVNSVSVSRVTRHTLSNAVPRRRPSLQAFESKQWIQEFSRPSPA
jgi:hypothetical protein